MRLWVCIPVFNRLEFTKRCLESLRRQDHGDYRIVICDDGSTDGTSEYLQRHEPDVEVVAGNGDLWWTGGINACIEHVLAKCSDDDAIVTLNNDLVVEPDYLSALERVAAAHPNALVGSACVDIETGKLMPSARRHSWLTAKSTPIRPTPGSSIQPVDRLPGRGTLIRTQVFRDLGLFDFEHLPHYAADLDFAHRASRHGYELLLSYEAKVFSHIDETGMAGVNRSLSMAGLTDFFSNRRSPANLRARFWLAVNNCPKPLLPSYLILDFGRLVGNYLRHNLREGSKRE
jgi:GT2 family glycosyltransferase